jgi:putative tryptophan/tyrosine transport system substrate-binding protein
MSRNDGKRRFERIQPALTLKRVTHSSARQAVEVASKKLGEHLIMAAAATIEDFPGAFSEMSRERVDGFLVIAFPIATLRRESLAQLALQRRLPSVFGLKAIVQAGGLMSYGATLSIFGGAS